MTAPRCLSAAMAGLVVATSTVLLSPPAAAMSAPGAVVAWGGNPDGVLGTNSADPLLTTPKPVLGLDAGTVSVDGSFAASPFLVQIRESGVLRRLIGDPDPRDVAFSEVSAGRTHQLALTEKQSRVWEWGTLGGDGDGDGVEDSVSEPRPVPEIGVEGAADAIGAGDGFSVAIGGENKDVWTWGRNDRGQLGRETAEEYDPTPTPVPGLTDIVDIAVGWGHVVALDSAGRVYTWGDGRDGQLGHGDFAGRATPGDPVVLAHSAIAGVEAGPFASYVITRDGLLYAFGDNYYGNLGRADDESDAGTGSDRPLADPVPKLVEGISGVRNAAGNPINPYHHENPDNPIDVVAASSTNLYVLTQDGHVLALGSNRDGGLGNGRADSDEIQAVPTAVPGIDGALAVEAHSTGLTSFAQAIVEPPDDGPGEEIAVEFGDSGGYVSTERGGVPPSPSDPVDTAVTTTVGGVVSITEREIDVTAPTGFTFLGQQVDITAPVQTVDNPLRLQFTIDASVLPEGESADTLRLFRDGQPIEPCLSSTRAAPDPCIVSRLSGGGGDVFIEALSSHASAWNVGVPSAPSANLTVRATAPTSSLVGSDLTATVTVRNDGPAVATGATATVTLPMDAVRAATMPTGCIGTGPLTCSLGDLAVGASVDLAVTATPVRPGTARFGASVSTTASDTGTADNTATITTSVVGVACTRVGTQAGERLTGTTGTDVLCGLGGNDTVLGGRGDDAVIGGSGDDVLDGEAGRDAVSGGAGKDTVRGGDGDDLVDVRDGAPGDSADGGRGSNRCTRDTGDTVSRCR